MVSGEEITQAIVAVGKGKPKNSVFKVSEVRDYLGLRHGVGWNERIRKHFRENYEALRRRRLLLLMEYNLKRKNRNWFILKS